VRRLQALRVRLKESTHRRGLRALRGLERALERDRERFDEKKGEERKERGERKEREERL
jgi:hypothetical protein